MTRIKDRENAIRLRKFGFTYSEIKKKLDIPKSTLSNWLSNFHLNQKELEKLQKRKDARKLLGIEKTRITKAARRRVRIDEIFKTEKANLLPLANRELYIAGLFLYWGEGLKNIRNPTVSLTNTDPEVIKFYIVWLKKSLNIRTNKMRVYLHLYSDMNVEKSLKYWSKELNISLSGFGNPYIKTSKREKITHKGHGYGTCNLSVHDARLKEKVMLGIKSLADYYASA